MGLKRLSLTGQKLCIADFYVHFDFLLIGCLTY